MNASKMCSNSCFQKNEEKKGGQQKGDLSDVQSQSCIEQPTYKRAYHHVKECLFHEKLMRWEHCLSYAESIDGHSNDVNV